MKPLSTIAIVLLALGIALCHGLPHCLAQSISENRQLASDANLALGNLDFKTARQLAGKLADTASSDGFRLIAADTLLRSGDSKRATELFDQCIESRPEQEPYLWQRGIALYFLGRFKEGAEQFEVHRKVNPNDVENAAWHFLCIAKQDSPEAAKKMLLPAPGDSRAPMEEVLAMLESGNTEKVKQRMDSFADDETRARSAKFYGNFYLGLYADALGDTETAQKHLDASAADAPKNYMGDIARVYAKHLKDAQ
jgi:lipoprotein NlpI